MIQQNSPIVRNFVTFNCPLAYRDAIFEVLNENNLEKPRKVFISLHFASQTGKTM